MGGSRKAKPRIGTLGNLLELAFTSAGTDADVYKSQLSDSKRLPGKEDDSADGSWESGKKSTKLLSKKTSDSYEDRTSRPDNKSSVSEISLELKKKKKKNKGKRTAPAAYGAFNRPVLDLSCYGKNFKNNKSNQTSSAKPKNQFDIKILGILEANRAAFPEYKVQHRDIPVHKGIEVNLAEAKNDENEIIIGLDFGTSSVKVVIHDPQRRVFYAVPFFSIGGPNPYIYPSRVYLTEDQYSLEKGDIVYSDLKLPLMADVADPIQLNHAVAFLALIIRHARGWFFTHHAETYRNVEIFWSMNLGLPTARVENNSLCKRFKQIALAAINLAGDPSLFITKHLTGDYLNRSQSALISKKDVGKLQIHPDVVNVYPEIIAQVTAFIESESWDEKNRPLITMIDIGAGTVDVSFFSVKRERSKRQFNCFSNSVEPNGVINLHRTRMAWLKTVLKERNLLSTEIEEFLNEISISTAQILSIPEKVNDYLKNFEVGGENNIDRSFFQSYAKLVFGLLKHTRMNRVPLNDENWKRLPVFLCGGGSRMAFYKNIIDYISTREPNWLGAEAISLSTPRELKAEGLNTKDYDRLSVAYGLSLPEIGKIIPSYEIEDFKRSDLPKRERAVDLTDDG